MLLKYKASTVSITGRLAMERNPQCSFVHLCMWKFFSAMKCDFEPILSCPLSPNTHTEYLNHATTYIAYTTYGTSPKVE